MRDESTKQAAQEFLAAKLAEENQRHEEKLNKETAVARSLHVWKYFRDSIFAQCNEWNSVTQEESLTCKETPMGDLRIWCPSRSKQMTVHYDSKKLVVTIKNAARDESQKDAILTIEGYTTNSGGRDAQLVRNNEPVNVHTLILGELRLLTGIGRQRSA
jgi:hypothetical protein